jgi:hypothetical protein
LSRFLGGERLHQLATEVTLDAEVLEAFVASVRGPVSRPGDEGYHEARAVWNGLIDRRPALIVQCTGAADVVDAVNVAREQELMLSVKGGAHNVAGNAVNDGGLVIDLSLMRGVHVDPLTRTVRAQGEVTWGDCDRETQLFGLAVPGGVVSTTGIGGLTLHGGVGHLRRSTGCRSTTWSRSRSSRPTRPPESRNAAPPKPGHCEVPVEPGPARLSRCGCAVRRLAEIRTCDLSLGRRSDVRYV